MYNLASVFRDLWSLSLCSLKGEGAPGAGLLGPSVPPLLSALSWLSVEPTGGDVYGAGSLVAWTSLPLYQSEIQHSSRRNHLL